MIRGCGESFTAGTKVLLASSAAIPISQLKPGDKVLGTNVKTGKTQSETVTAVLVKHDTDLYDLRVKAGSRIAVIDTTSKHLFWIPAIRGQSGRWVKAGVLRYGTHLRTPGKGTVTVLSGWTPKVTVGWMWDLTVQSDHDFYVDVVNAPVLVHNCSSSQGVYSFEDQWNPGKTYVGESMNLKARLGYWVREGRLSSVEDADCIHVCGTQDDVFAAEAQRIAQLRQQGVPLSNQIASPGRTILNARQYVQLPLW